MVNELWLSTKVNNHHKKNTGKQTQPSNTIKNFQEFSTGPLEENKFTGKGVSNCGTDDRFPFPTRHSQVMNRRYPRILLLGGSCREWGQQIKINSEFHSYCFCVFYDFSRFQGCQEASTDTFGNSKGHIDFTKHRNNMFLEMSVY